MFHYLTFQDGTEVVHSQIAENGEDIKVVVHFERPCEDGFFSARFELPTYTLIENDGFNNSELDFFIEFLQNNAHLLYKYAICGGIKIA